MNDDERPPALWRGMWTRFLIGGVLIVLLAGGATATVALNTASSLAHEIFPAANQITAPKGLVTPEYSGGPQTFLILGSDRREGSKDSYDKEDPPHSDTILLVRFDPEQGQTSVLSIPRDLMVNITTPKFGAQAIKKAAERAMSRHHRGAAVAPCRLRQRARLSGGGHRHRSRRPGSCDRPG